VLPTDVVAEQRLPEPRPVQQLGHQHRQSGDGAERAEQVRAANPNIS